MMSSLTMWNHSEFREVLAAGMEGVGLMFLQPAIGIEEVVLLGPEHAGQGLAHHVGCIRGDRGWSHGTVELVRLLQASGEGLVNPRPEGDGEGLIGEAQAHRHRLAGTNHLLVVRRALGALVVGIHRRLVTLNHIVVDAVFDVRAGVRVFRKEPLVVRFVLGKEQRHFAVAVQVVRAQYGMLRRHRTRARRSLDLLEQRFLAMSGNP